MNSKTITFLQGVVGVAASVLSANALGTTEIMDTDGDIHLTLEGSPYRLVESVTVDAYDSGSCAVAQETLRVDDGVELDLNGRAINIRGGILDVGQATLNAPGFRYSFVNVSDRSVCGQTTRGRATIAEATLVDVGLTVEDTATLTVSDSAFRDSTGSRADLIFLRDGVSAEFSESELGLDVRIGGSDIGAILREPVSCRRPAGQRLLHPCGQHC